MVATHAAKNYGDEFDQKENMEVDFIKISKFWLSYEWFPIFCAIL